MGGIEMSDKMRESFEQWAMSSAIDLRMDKDAWGQDRYYHSHIDAMWLAWQAAHAAALPPGFVAAGYMREVDDISWIGCPDCEAVHGKRLVACGPADDGAFQVFAASPDTQP